MAEAVAGHIRLVRMIDKFTDATGVWVAFGIMASVGIGLGLLFWRKRYLGTHPSG